MLNYKKYEFYFFRANSIRNSSLFTDPTDPTKLMIENVEFKVPFKIELSIDSLELEETKTSHMYSKKSSSFYSIPIKNVCAYSDLSPSNKIWYSGDLLNKSLRKFFFKIKTFNLNCFLHSKT